MNIVAYPSPSCRPVGSPGLFSDQAGPCCENTLPPSRGWIKQDRVAETLQASDEPPFDGLTIALVEIVLAQVAIDVPLAEQVVGDNQDGVANGDRRPLCTAPCSEPVILGRQVRAFGASRRSGGLDQRRA